MPKPNQLGKPQFTEMDPTFQTHYNQLIDTVNTLAGHNGPIELSNHLNLSGNQVTNVGPSKSPTSVLTSAAAQQQYSATAIRPQLESNGSFPLQTMRRLNDPNQRETQSSYLNDLMSSVPNANQIFPIITTLGGGVQVVIGSTSFKFADGTQVVLQGRTDLLSFPASFTISSISSSGNLVTLDTATSSGLTAGQTAYVEGVTPSGFNGLWQITSATPPFQLTYQASLGTVIGSGGTLLLNGVYYYSVNKRSAVLKLSGPFASDTASNRITTCLDGSQIVAVVVVTASGGQVEQSGGGGSPLTGSPAGGAFF